MTDATFKAERVFRSASIVLHGPIDTVFLLFGPVEEEKWEDDWTPTILYPPSKEVEEGMVFTTQAHTRGETRFAWIVSKYQPDNHLVEYIVSTENRCWVIHIQCIAMSAIQTQALIKYTFTGLTPLGNEINKQSIEKMYERNLADWEEAINYYLSTGKTLKAG